MSPRLLLKILLLTTAALLLFACGGGDGGSVGPPRVPARLEVLSPTSVVTTDGVALPADSAPSVRVLTADSLPVRQVTVSFTLDSGPATLGGGTALPGGARGITTGADGVASLPTWIPAALAGEAETTQSVVTARLRDKTGALLDSVRFTARGVGNRWEFVPASQSIAPFIRLAPVSPIVWWYDGIDVAGVDLVANIFYMSGWRPTFRFGAGLVPLDGRLFVTGGAASSPRPGCYGPGRVCSTSETWDPATQEWTPAPELLAPRAYHASAWLGPSVYVVGGIDSLSQAVATVERLDTASGTWQPRAPLLAPRRWPSAVTMNGALYVGGGSQGERTIERYNAAGNSWAVAATLPDSLSRASLTTLRGQLYVSGNPYTPGGISSTIRLYRWDPATTTWTPLRTPTLARTDTEAAAMDGKIWLLGGSSGAEGPGMLVYTP